MTESCDRPSTSDSRSPGSSQETFKNAFEYAAFGMALVGTDGSFLQVNQSACEMFGYPAEELVTKTFPGTHLS